MFDAYIRVSQLGERAEDEATEVYEAQVREWADRQGLVLDLVLDDTDVPGSVAVADRKLERLVRRVEVGESEGIVTPYLDRFGRDLIEGAVALKRITDAGGKLVAVNDGFDSSSAGSELVFNLRLSIAQDFLRRTQANWKASRKRARANGIYLAARPPFGFMRGEQRQLVKDPDEAPLVRELFQRRARDANYAELRRWLCAKLPDLPPDPHPETGEDRRLRTISKQSIRRIIANPVYKGMIPLDERDASGERRFERGKHDPIVSDEEWQAAQRTHDYVPRTGTSSNAKLRGLVFCQSCGARMKTGLSGPKGRRLSSYVCQNPDCDARASIRTTKLDNYVLILMREAAYVGDPHVAAVIEGDTRYSDALRDVEEAEQLLAEYRDDIEIQRALGRADYAKGLRIRKDAVAKARRAFSRIPPPDAARQPLPVDDDSALTAALLRPYVREVRVVPAGIEGRGKRIPVHERAYVFWTGSDSPYEPAHLEDEEVAEWLREDVLPPDYELPAVHA